MICIAFLVYVGALCIYIHADMCLSLYVHVHRPLRMQVSMCVNGSQKAVYQRQQANNVCLNGFLNESSVLWREHKALKQNLLDLL